jgi:hypothetical protein
MHGPYNIKKCPSSGRLAHAVLWHFFMHPYKKFGLYQYVFYIKHILISTACTSLPEDEHLVVRNMSKKLYVNQIINEKSAHFVGSYYISVQRLRCTGPHFHGGLIKITVMFSRGVSPQAEVWTGKVLNMTNCSPLNCDTLAGWRTQAFRWNILIGLMLCIQ